MPFAIFIMGIIIVAAFLTVVAVMYYGSKENLTMHDEGSAAVEAWRARATSVNPPPAAPSQVTAPVADAAAVSASASATVEDTAEEAAGGADTGKGIGDLSEDEKEAKRQAALARRAARAAKKTESDS